MIDEPMNYYNNTQPRFGESHSSEDYDYRDEDFRDFKSFRRTLKHITIFMGIFLTIIWIFKLALRKKRCKRVTQRLQKFLELENVGENEVILSSAGIKEIIVDIFGEVQVVRNEAVNSERQQVVVERDNYYRVNT